ncbi:MAG: hypothetical protein HY916_07110 [Desulfovibrio sp.]|nr:hypothetical protein [Desulfovibrio sp.]
MHYDPRTKKSTPYPNAEWNTRRTTDDRYLDDVLGLRNDSQGVVWMLDMGTKSGVTPKLVGWNTRANKLERIYYIPAPASLRTSQLNDFVLDETRGVAVIADEEIANGGDGTKAALVILDMKTGATRRVLAGDKSTRPENMPIVSDGKQLNIPGTQKPILVGADGITLDRSNTWLYFAPLNGSAVYRIRMDDLLRTPDNALPGKVETYAKKKNNGGLSIDVEGNLYLTYVGDKAVGVIPADTRTARTYAADAQLIWPDGVSYNKDGYMYVSAAQLPLAGVFNNGKDMTRKPFAIFRFKPLAPGIWGR